MIDTGCKASREDEQSVGHGAADRAALKWNFTCRGPVNAVVIGLTMPYHIAYAVKTESIDAVSTAIEASTQCHRQGHESSYLGVYDLFRIPEDLMVKYNFVEEDEWDYPEHKDRNVLVIAPQTDRPDHIATLVVGLGIDAVLVERKTW